MSTTSNSERTLRHLCWSLTLAALALASCSTLRVGADYDRSASFTTYHTFVVMQRQHSRVHNPLVATRAQDDIIQALQDKGYRQVTDPANADFTVDFTIGSHERTQIQSYPTAYASGGWGGWGWGPGWWGDPYWGPDVNVQQIQEGTLSIDVFDAHTHRPVWHGWAKKQLTNKDIEQSTQPIREAVDAILAQFPPKSA